MSMSELLECDFDLGLNIKKIISRAILYFTGDVDEAKCFREWRKLEEKLEKLGLFPFP